MLPIYVRERKDRARDPRPVEHAGRLHDIMGVSPDMKDLVLRDTHAIQQDVRIETFTGRLVTLNNKCWRVVSLEATAGLPWVDSVITMVLENSESGMVTTVSPTDMKHVRILSANGEHRLGLVKHGIMRMEPVVPRVTSRIRLQPGLRFEARLWHRELQGPYMIEVGKDGQLTATGLGPDGKPQYLSITPAHIAPRYVTVASPDFGACFDVDTFAHREDQLRSHATHVGANPDGGPIQDPLFACLPPDVVPRITNGAAHLGVFEQFIRRRIATDGGPADADADAAQRRLTIFNLSISNQGDACQVLKALVDFRSHNPAADIRMVVSKLGPTQFQETPEFRQYLDILAHNDIHIDTYAGTHGPTRQVMHAKGIVIDDQVLFSTGAVMDTWPINKSDLSIELPPPAATVFRRYVDEAVHHDATHHRRAELAANLAALGVVINEPVVGLAYISRAQDALIRGAYWNLTLSLSELVDPTMTKLIIHRASSGVDVMIQVRELDAISARLLAVAMSRYPNLRLEDSSWWEPRPHFNAIIADGTAAYIGSSYLWSTQRNMVHHGRSFENGVLLHGKAAAHMYSLIDDLRIAAHRDNPVAMACGIFKSWSTQYTLYQESVTMWFSDAIKQVLFNVQPALATLAVAPTKKASKHPPQQSKDSDDSDINHRHYSIPDRYHVGYMLHRSLLTKIAIDQ